MKKEAGFTLVEIAIVLVVIGLLLGAILAGQEVVLNGQIRNTINEYNNVASATFVYQDRYRQIPGDDATAGGAAGRWGATATNGNGDRVIDGTWDATNPVPGTSEGGIFWHHLRNDELVAGPRSNAVAGAFNLPLNAFNGQIGVQQNAFNQAGALTGQVICQSNIPAKAAAIIDSRIDDETGNGLGSATGSLQGGDMANAPATNAGAVGTYNGAVTEFILCRELG